MENGGEGGRTGGVGHLRGGEGRGGKWKRTPDIQYRVVVFFVSYSRAIGEGCGGGGPSLHPPTPSPTRATLHKYTQVNTQVLLPTVSLLVLFLHRLNEYFITSGHKYSF